MRRDAALFALALLTAGSALAQAAPPAARVTVTPGRLELWRQGRASVTLEADAPVERVRFTTSVGRIGEVRRTSTRSFVATWFAPEEAYPQIAVVTANVRHASGWVEAWAPLVLWGLGNAEVRARPNTEITVGIGDRRYGPVRTNSRGVARVPVEVAPGDEKAYHGTTAIPLAVPVPLRVHLAVPVDAVRVGTEVVVPVRAFVVTPEGARAPKPEVAFSPEVGEVFDVRATGAGTVAAKWRIPANASGTLRLRARPDEVGARETSLVLAAVPELPKRIEVTADATEIVAGHREVVFTARALDARDRPVAIPLAFESNLCALAPRVRGDATTATCTLPEHFGAARRLEVTASASSLEGTVEAQLSLPLRAAQPERLWFEPSARRVRADGFSSVKLRVRVEDRFGNPVVEPPPEVARAPQSGALGAWEGSPNGEFVAEYRAPRRRSDGVEVIGVRSGGIQAESELALRGYSPWLSVTPSAWFVSNFRDVNAPRLGAEVEVALPLWGDELVLGAEGGAFAAPFSRSPVAGTTVFATGLGSASWRRRFGWGSLFGGGGGGAARLVNRIAVTGQPAEVESAWAPAFAVGGGAELSGWMGGPRLMVRYLWVADSGLDTLGGPLRSLDVGIGYRFELR